MTHPLTLRASLSSNRSHPGASLPRAAEAHPAARRPSIDAYSLAPASRLRGGRAEALGPVGRALARVRSLGAEDHDSSLRRLLAERRPEAPFRELQGHLLRHGLPLATRAPLSELIQKELAVARALDPRVDQAAMNRAVRRSEAALDLRPIRQVDLFGFTALIDAKFPLTGRYVTALCDLAAASVGREALLSAIDQGPGGGATVWKAPGDVVQLAASVVRHLVLGQGASLQLQLAHELVPAIQRCAAETGVEVREAMGGAGAFAANLASVLPNVEPHFFSDGPLPEGLVQRFAPGVRVVDARGAARAVGEARDPALRARVNYIAEYSANDPFFVSGGGGGSTVERVRVDGRMVSAVTPGRGRIILGTPSHERPGFGALDGAGATRLGEAHDLAFLVGAHYFTRGSAAECRAQAEGLATQLDALRAANPKLVRHLQYVVPKDPQNEGTLFSVLRGHFDSISLNAVELPELLHRLDAAGLTAWDTGPEVPRSTAEHPEFELRAALALADAVGAQRVHVHGLRGDLVVLPREGHDPERQVLALVRARQLAAMKTANASGEIRDPSEIWRLAPVIEGESLAAVQTFADAVAARNGLTPEQRDHVAERWWFEDPTSRRLIVFAPARGLHDTTGGLVSLGDTIDASALIYALGHESKVRSR